MFSCMILSNLKFVYVFRVASGACIYVVFTYNHCIKVYNSNY